MEKLRVFIDTNIIIESFRVDCWQVISHQFFIETADKCVEETKYGNANHQNYTDVPTHILQKGLTNKHTVSCEMLARLICADPCCDILDAGEMHLLALLFVNKNLLFSNNIKIATADKAALRACDRLGWLDSVVSLEEMMNKAGTEKAKIKKLRLQYHKDWLSNFKTDIKLKIY